MSKRLLSIASVTVLFFAGSAQAALEDAQDSLPGEQGTFGHLGECSEYEDESVVTWEDAIDPGSLDKMSSIGDTNGHGKEAKGERPDSKVD